MLSCPVGVDVGWWCPPQHWMYGWDDDDVAKHKSLYGYRTTTPATRMESHQRQQQQLQQMFSGLVYLNVCWVFNSIHPSMLHSQNWEANRTNGRNSQTLLLLAKHKISANIHSFIHLL